MLMQDLGVKHVMAKFVLRLLLLDQTEHLAAVINDLIQTATNEPDFLKKSITGDEYWVAVHGYNPEMKTQLSQWKSLGSPHPKKVWQSCNKMKTMLTVFFDWKGVVHQENTPPGQTIYKQYYLNILHQLWVPLEKMAAAMSTWWLASSLQHTGSQSTSPAEFFGETSNHPGDSAPLQPRCDALQLLAFPRTKISFERNSDHCWDQENMMGQLMTIPTKDFAECFEQWRRCWKKCLGPQGAYFEGDWGVILLCRMFLGSCTFFNKCLYFSHCMDGYFLEGTHIIKTSVVFLLTLG